MDNTNSDLLKAGFWTDVTVPGRDLNTADETARPLPARYHRSAKPTNHLLMLYLACLCQRVQGALDEYHVTRGGFGARLCRTV